MKAKEGTRNGVVRMQLTEKEDQGCVVGVGGVAQQKGGGGRNMKGYGKWTGFSTRSHCTIAPALGAASPRQDPGVKSCLVFEG